MATRRLAPKLGATLMQVLALAIPLMGPAAQVAPPTNPPSLTSAAVDATVFRDGEVKRFSSTHATWTVVCDEVTRLKQRFCSLRSPITSNAGAAVAQITISTGDDGRPAALLALVAGFVEGGSVEISATNPAQGPQTAHPKAKVADAKLALTRVKPMRCEQGVCTVIWTLKSEHIAALVNGWDLKIAATTAGSQGSNLKGFAKSGAPSSAATTELLLPAVGFADAVAVSLRPFE